MSLSPDIRDSLDFEKSNRVEGSVLDNDFYKAPPEAAQAPPGRLLHLEENLDTSEFLLPPTTALSRFVYQSENLRGSRVPVSAFILWPYSPRSQPDGYSMVAWAHGTSGFGANAAPSNQKNLWQHFQAPYQLSLQGYIVVGTDYAGLGVREYSSGGEIIHEYLTPPSQAKDVIYAVQAAQAAFPKLSKQFVAIGQSQGGGAVWGIAEIAATISVPGYLGSVAISPYTNILEEDSQLTGFLAANMIPSMASILPDFRPSDVLTPEGERQIKVIYETDPGISSAVAILSGTEPLKPDWKSNSHFRKYLEMTANGGKPVGGPLFIAHGTGDPVLSEKVAAAAVRKTASVNPSASIDYYTLPGVTHVSALSASQPSWMDWIADRFAGREAEPGCRQTELKSVQPLAAHQGEQNWYLKPATKPYHAPGP